VKPLKIVKDWDHVYEHAALYRMGFGHGPAHIAYETVLMLQVLDRVLNTVDPITVLELGSGPRSFYKDAFLRYAPTALKAPVAKYLGSDFVVEPGVRDVIPWDFTKVLKTKLRVNVVLMPYYLVNSLMDFTTFKPMSQPLVQQFWNSVSTVLEPGGLLVAHTPYQSEAKRDRWKRERFIQHALIGYHLVPEVEAVFGLQPGTLKTPVFYKSHRSVGHDDVYNWDTVRRIVINGETTRGQPVSLEARFRKSTLYYPVGKIQYVQSQKLVPVAKFLDAERADFEDLVTPVALKAFTDTQYWTVYRNA